MLYENHGPSRLRNILGLIKTKKCCSRRLTKAIWILTCSQIEPDLIVRLRKHLLLTRDTIGQEGKIVIAEIWLT